MDILLLNGVNLNTLGTREPEVYGNKTIADVELSVKTIAENNNFTFDCLQSNTEADLINKIHTSNPKFIIINPAAWTHTSVALRDALLVNKTPFVEVHISNVYKREEFRHKSYFSDIAIGVIAGLGVQGYELATDFAVKFLQNNK
jgi:3-dehydroquinate dehydratase-2